MRVDRTAESTTARERGLLLCGVVGPLLFVAVFLVESAFHPPGYDPVRHTVSAFVLGDSGWVQRVSFLVSGGLVLASAVGLRPALARLGGGRWAPVLIGLFGGGLMGAGIFATDPVAAGVTAAAPYPLGAAVTADRTVPGVLHDLFGVPAFIGLPIACGVVAYRMAVAGRRAWAAYSAATAVAFSACFVLSAIALRQPSSIAPVGGLLQRVTIVLGWTWLAALAFSLFRRAEAPRPTARAAPSG